jgi:Protein of unknown function (DUF4240)
MRSKERRSGYGLRVGWSIYTLNYDGKPYFVGRTTRPVVARATEHDRWGRPSGLASVPTARWGTRANAGLLARLRPQPSVNGVTSEDFWSLVENARTAADLHKHLRRLSAVDLAAFEGHHDDAFHRAYNWGLWGAVYTMQHGCSDDAFAYFRAYLISLGRFTYESVLADPDSLAEPDVERDEAVWESWMSPTMMVIYAQTGQFGFAGDLDPTIQPNLDPTGEPWEEDEVRLRFPKLATRYA